MNVKDWLGKDNKLAIDIWEKKYCFEGESFEEWLDRVSGGDASVKDLIINKKFLFGGRILSNRGLDKRGVKVTYSNCYVIEPPEDNLESIFDCGKKLARTFSYGGGCGIDLSKLAPRGAKVNNTARSTSGAVSFMDFYSMITGLIGQNGRRGALMISMDCSHPDIEEFIGIKSDLEKVTKANISVKITSEFMDAVRHNDDWTLSFTREETGEVITKVVKAADIYHKICEMNWNYAEPGALFWDRIEQYNLLENTEEFKFAGTNPCAEEPLPAGGSCLLGALNLAEFVTEDGGFNLNEFRDAVRIAVKALNDVLDEGLELHPLQEQRDSVRDWRQIGLGVMGIADMLIKMEIEYGSDESLEICDTIAQNMTEEALRASAELALAYEPFPKCNSKEIMDTEFFIEHSDKDLEALVYQYGLRNSQLLTIAPTGTISTMLGVSGGIEPIFANYYVRKTESLHDGDVFYKVYTPIVDEYMKKHHIKDDSQLPKFFVTAQELDYTKRIDMQSIWQKHIDASISSTVNVPNEFTVEQVKDLYMYAWEKDLKGITIYRDGCERSAILSTEPKKEEPKTDVVNTDDIKYDSIVPMSRKTIGVTHGSTYCKKSACGTLYITLNRDDEGNLVESFVQTSKGGICQANIGAVNRMVSVALRSGVKVDEIVDQLKGINCAACTKMVAKGEKLDGISCSDILAKTLSEFSKGSHDVKHSETPGGEKCPDCGGSIKYEGGCVVCLECGWSKCG